MRRAMVKREMCCGRAARLEIRRSLVVSAVEFPRVLSELARSAAPQTVSPVASETARPAAMETARSAGLLTPRPARAGFGLQRAAACRFGSSVIKLICTSVLSKEMNEMYKAKEKVNGVFGLTSL